MLRPLHPFPARMASDLALDRLTALPADSIVLDPMVGSGTVIKQAAALGLEAQGYDVDPLAVLMARTWVAAVDDAELEDSGERLTQEVGRRESGGSVYLPWIDDDKETREFVNYWFAPLQQLQLRRLASRLQTMRNVTIGASQQAVVDALYIALSRIIVTKEQAASLARDTSHSRPHRVAVTSGYDVVSGFRRSVKEVRQRLKQGPTSTRCSASLGDARELGAIVNDSIDAIVTSPPYLNAIDYMRGHRLALVWMGYRIADLRMIRSASVGAERGLAALDHSNKVRNVAKAMGAIEELPARWSGMVERYACDLIRIVQEAYRVLKPGGCATYIIGNSCLKGTFLSNADSLARAAQLVGFTELERTDRELPLKHRYLPVTGGLLSKRMKTETVFTFQKQLYAA